MREKNNLRELSFLEQFLASIKRLADGLAALQPSHLCVKYRHLYSECRFALNVLKWRVEDDISRLGMEDQSWEEQENRVIIDDVAWGRLEELVASVDLVIQEAEKQGIDVPDVSGWCINYDREEDKTSFKLVYEDR